MYDRSHQPDVGVKTRCVASRVYLREVTNINNVRFNNTEPVCRGRAAYSRPIRSLVAYDDSVGS